MLPLRMTREMVMTKNGNTPFFIYLSILYYCTFQENRHNRHLFVHNLFFKQGYIISPGHKLVPEPIPGRVMVRQIRKLQIRKENTNCTLQPRLLQYHCTYPQGYGASSPHKCFVLPASLQAQQRRGNGSILFPGLRRDVFAPPQRTAYCLPPSCSLLLRHRRAICQLMSSIHKTLGTFNFAGAPPIHIMTGGAQ